MFFASPRATYGITGAIDSCWYFGGSLNHWSYSENGKSLPVIILRLLPPLSPHSPPPPLPPWYVTFPGPWAAVARSYGAPISRVKTPCRPLSAGTSLGPPCRAIPGVVASSNDWAFSVRSSRRESVWGFEEIVGVVAAGALLERREAFGSESQRRQAAGEASAEEVAVVSKGGDRE